MREKKTQMSEQELNDLRQNSALRMRERRLQLNEQQLNQMRENARTEITNE